MFDTGCGENEVKGDYKIKYIIEKITSLPLTLIQSHFHFDHNQNIHEFGQLHKLDDFLSCIEETSGAGDVCGRRAIYVSASTPISFLQPPFFTNSVCSAMVSKRCPHILSHCIS